MRVSATLKFPCPTCHRLGKVPKAFPSGTVMGYCGPDGESWPHELCQTCNGVGWVDGQYSPPPVMSGE